MFPKIETTEEIQHRMDCDAATAERVRQKQVNRASTPLALVLNSPTVFDMIDTLSFLNKELERMAARHTDLRESIIKAMKMLKTRQIKTPANVTATLFHRAMTFLDSKKIKLLLSAKQFKSVATNRRIMTLKVTS